LDSKSKATSTVVIIASAPASIDVDIYLIARAASASGEAEEVAFFNEVAKMAGGGGFGNLGRGLILSRADTVRHAVVVSNQADS